MARPNLARRALLGAAALAAALATTVAAIWLTGPDPAPLARENPRTTALIEQRRAEARERRRPFHPRQLWVGLDRISPRLVEAVIASEDANFFGHEGIDWVAMQEAAEHDLKVHRFARGASTITQQLAKNLWLGTSKSLWRKLREAVLASKLERTLSKRRILAIYLNVVELDEGVFGIEAGARHRFGTSAAALDTAQAAVLASSLPAPRRVDLARPSSWLKSRARRLLDRMRDAGRIDVAEHLRASAELERILAGPAPAEDRDEPPEDDEARPAGPGVASVRPGTPPRAAPEGVRGELPPGDAAPAAPEGPAAPGAPADAPPPRTPAGAPVSGAP